MTDKKIKYVAMVGFSAKGKVTPVGKSVPEFDKQTMDQLIAMGRVMPADSDEAVALIKSIKGRNDRAEADRKKAEAAGRIAAEAVEADRKKAGQLPGTGK